MESNPSLTPIQSIDVSTLTPIVRQLVHRNTFSIQDWHVSQLGGGVGNPVSLGLYRFEGIAQDQDERIAWSVILKIIQSPANEGRENLGEGDDQTHWNYWKREPLVYRSGLLETLPGGLTAPRCFGVVEILGNLIWLWLEDVADSFGGAWSLDRYALGARHLGQLNGIFLSERSLPSFPWLSRHRSQQWINAVPWQTIPWEHPQVRERYPKLEMNSFQRMLAENERFLQKLELLPQTLCHGDTYPTNFMSRDLPNNQQQTVALDWALAGIAPVGADLGQLVFGAQNNLQEVNRIEIDKALFESYLDGLRDSGCKIDAQYVRFGYTAFAALQVGLFHIYWMGEALKESGTMIKEAIEHPAIPDCYEVVMAHEAYKLLEVV
jgi:phosphotransferase family enzyme